jgi:ATP-dependent Lon protease
MPVIIEDSSFIYPFMITPIFLSDQSDIKSANIAIETNGTVLVVAAKESVDPNGNIDYYDIGVIGNILRKSTMPDGRVKVLFQGISRGEIIDITTNDPLTAEVTSIEAFTKNHIKTDAILSILKEKVRVLSKVSALFPSDMLKTIEENHEPNRVIELVASSLKLKSDTYYKLLAQNNTEQRLLDLIDVIIEEIESGKLQKEINIKVNSRIEKINKEYFLKEQLKQIQNELGVDNQRDEEIEEYRQKLKAKKPFMPEDGYKETKKQIDKFARMHPDSADANMLQSYLDWVLEMPFEKLSTKKLSIQAVRKQLDHDHFSLQKPKERIVEYFAVRELLEKRGLGEKEGKGAILCFAGPPGVGKTSLANSIATAMKRELIRIALGGLEDVNELRGHRRTYIGAMPGRIVQGLIEAKQMNPVVVLDEIDKVSRSFRGDPTSVLLEILDPEQNNKFRDYYLNFNIDLSRVIFVATANDVSKIPAPLRDRMEFITLNSYTPQEKFQIAKKYLIPQELKKHGLKASELNITASALEKIISNYTREAGVRNLRRKIADISRKAATKLLEDENALKITIKLSNIEEYLEKPIFEIDEKEKHDYIGIVNGLAWTSVGGDVLKIEVTKIQGKGTLQLTGSLGDVMKESARIALSVVKVLIDSKKLKIALDNIPKLEKEIESKIKPEASDAYRRYDLHLHVPEGATPKDGPSAGIAMATAISSILSDKKVRADVAMTGELTLSGKVLPIGGLKEKLIAAYKAKIKTVIIPKKNFERDLDDIPDEVKNALEFVPASDIGDVLKVALI